jgi:hypothetical protein
MKKMLFLLLTLAAFTRASLAAQQSSGDWHIRVEVKSILQVRLRFISIRVPGGAVRRFSLLILDSSSSAHPLVLLEIGDRHHA